MKNMETINIIGLADFPFMKKVDDSPGLIFKTAEKIGVSIEDRDIQIT